MAAELEEKKEAPLRSREEPPEEWVRAEGTKRDGGGFICQPGDCAIIVLGRSKCLCTCAPPS